MIIKESVKKLSDLWEMRFDTGYIKDLNVAVRFYRGAANITDLTNAMKPGKICREWSLQGADGEHRDTPSEMLLDIFLDDSCTFEQFVQNLRNDKYTDWIVEGYGLKLYKRTEKSIRTFSPFVAVKKQDLTGEVRRVAKVAKALIAGQFKKVECAYIYTDDYYYDYANNYGKGRVIDVLDFAKELVERPDYWTVWKDEQGEIKAGDFNSCYYLKTA